MRKSAWNMSRLLAGLLVAVLLLSLAPAPMTVQAKDNKGEKIIVSMGDSYSAGEGILDFYCQDLPLSEKVREDDWLAHRSKNAWSGMLKVPGISGTLSNHRNTNWYFVASSGATTHHIQSVQNKDYNKKEHLFSEPYKDSKDLDPQIKVFDQFQKGEVDYVTITMGGNDAHFGDVVKNAALNGYTFWNPNELSDILEDTWEEFDKEDGIRDRLEKTYKHIQDAAGEQAHIIVAGYPQLLCILGDTTLPVSLNFFDLRDAIAINDAVSKFNDKIEELVEECAKKEKINIHFVSVEEEFAGHAAYSAVPYIHPVYLGARSEDRKDIMLTSEYSIHPNYLGAKAYARCVQAKIDELEGLSNVTCTTKLQITVRGYDGKPYDDYKIKIEGKENSGLFGWGKKDYSKNYTVTTAEPKSITLPEGTYKITVTDGDISYYKNVTIKKKALQNGLLFETDFGYVPEEDDDSSGGGNDYYPDYVPDRVTSDERDVVLVLDVSGSMSGEPMEQTKRAARNFIDTVLQQDASIGLVTYDNYANMVSDFTIDGEYLKSCVNSLWDGGGTNIDAGLSVAQEMLRQSNAKKKIIVLMSDGLPNDGREGQQLIDFSNDIKNENVLIYTLGFFGEVSDKSQPQALMEGIASEGCHYEVDDADNLVFFFEDMADQINGTRYIYIRIACPVEVTVTHNGETLTSDGQTKSQRTDFGTLTFEQGADGSTDENSRVKILRLKEGESYDVQITGTGRGIMNYTIGFMDEDGQYSDMREFRNIKINKNTVIDTVADTGRTTTLKVDEDGDGKYDIRYRAGENERAEEVNDLWIYIAVSVAVVMVAAVMVIVLKVKKNKKCKEKTEEEGN